MESEALVAATSMVSIVGFIILGVVSAFKGSRAQALPALLLSIACGIAGAVSRAPHDSIAFYFIWFLVFSSPAVVVFGLAVGFIQYRRHRRPAAPDA